MNTRTIRLAIALSLAAPCALSQAYPNKSVRMIVGFAPGGVVDTPARIVASKLGEIWSTPVVVENRTGAGGSIAAEIVAKATPDGYTLLVCNGASHGVNPSFYKKLPYDPIKDFSAISMFGTTPNVLLVPTSSQTATVRILIDYAKANPGKVSIG